MREASRRGMTLVELLVVLAILAGLAVAVGANVTAVRERERTGRTERDGRAMAAALRQADGLSFVSDLGRAPASAEELCLLFGNAFLREPPAEDALGNPLPVASAAVAALPAYAVRTSDLPPGLASSATVPTYDAAELTSFAAFADRFPNVSLGAGWRGPYCEGSALDTEAASDDAGVAVPILRDGFGGRWEAETDAASGLLTALVSRGRDRTEDADGAAVAWQDRDLTFPVGAPGVSLAVRAKTSDGAAVTKLHVFVWQPEFTVPETGNPTVALACRYYAAANADSLTAAEGLTHGLRAVYVCASTAAGALAAPPQYLLLRPGVNVLSLTLHPHTAYPTHP